LFPFSTKYFAVEYSYYKKYMSQIKVKFCLSGFVVFIGALAKKWLFWLCEGSSLWVGACQMCHLRADLKLFLINAGGKKIKNIRTALSVCLLVVRL